MTKREQVYTEIESYKTSPQLKKKLKDEAKKKVKGKDKSDITRKALILYLHS